MFVCFILLNCSCFYTVDKLSYKLNFRKDAYTNKVTPINSTSIHEEDETSSSSHDMQALPTSLTSPDQGTIDKNNLYVMNEAWSTTTAVEDQAPSKKNDQDLSHILDVDVSANESWI